MFIGSLSKALAKALSRVPLSTWVKIGGGCALGAAAPSMIADGVAWLATKVSNATKSRENRRLSPEPRASV